MSVNDLESYSEIVKRVVEVVLPSMWSEECVFADVRARYHVIKTRVLDIQVKDNKVSIVIAPSSLLLYLFISETMT